MFILYPVWKFFVILNHCADHKSLPDLDCIILKSAWFTFDLHTIYQRFYLVIVFVLSL